MDVLKRELTYDIACCGITSIDQINKEILYKHMQSFYVKRKGINWKIWRCQKETSYLLMNHYRVAVTGRQFDLKLEIVKYILFEIKIKENDDSDSRLSNARLKQ